MDSKDRFRPFQRLYKSAKRSLDQEIPGPSNPDCDENVSDNNKHDKDCVVPERPWGSVSDMCPNAPVKEESESTDHNVWLVMDEPADVPSENPDQEKWNLHKDDYEKALRYAKMAEYTETVYNEPEEQRRLIKKPRHHDEYFTWSESGDNGESSDYDMVTQRQAIPALHGHLVHEDYNSVQGSKAKSGGKSVSKMHQENSVDSLLLKVMVEIKKIQETQNKHTHLLNQIISGRVPVEADDYEDILNPPVDTIEDFEAFNKKLEDEVYQKRVHSYFCSLGGSSPAESVRTMLRKVATNRVLGQYSMKGQKGKRRLEDLPVTWLIIKACMKQHRHAEIPVTQKQVEGYISTTIKACPHQKGGDKFNDPSSKRKTVEVLLEYSDPYSN